MGLPSGTVSFLFTDVEGSTALLHEGLERYAQLLEEHRRVLRAAFERHAGAEVDTQGDAFFAAFARATDAIAAAIDAQSELAVPVRMGIHTGEPLVGDEGYVGISVHRAARIAHAAHGGQIVISDATRALLVDDDVELRDLGEHRLKDLTAAQRLFQVGPGDFPPLKTLDVARTNLPVQPTRFIGREDELVSVLGLLQEQDTRLLTLIGPGGVGKTRLALQTAAEAADDFAGGVWFVSLAEERESEALRGRVASVLGLAKAEALEAYLREQELLLVLDNLEQIPEGGALVAQLLQQAPLVRVLAASREPLRVSAEQEYPVPPLDLSDAVALFARRARAVDPAFGLDGERATVEEICRRLDLLPLAVELAAARIRVLRPAALLDRLSHSLPLLKTSLIDVPERQRTLAATIAWSYEQLSAEEQEFFRRLAVFTGPFDVEAADAVTASDLDALDALADLAEKSLVVPVASADQPWFRLLQTIGEFALERLQADDDERAAWHRLAAFFREQAIALEQRHSIGSPVSRAELLQHERSLLAALRWASRHDPEVCRDLVADIWELAYVWLPREEAEAYASAGLELAGGNTPQRVKLLTILAIARWNAGDVHGALEATEQRFEVLDGLEEPALRAWAHNDRGIFLTSLPDLERADEEFKAAAELFARAGQPLMARVTRANIALGIAERERDFARAAALLEEAAAEPLSGHVPWPGGNTNLACLLVCLGDLDRGSQLTRAAYGGHITAGHHTMAGFCLELLGVIAQAEDQPERAALLFGAADQLHREYGLDSPSRLDYETALIEDARAGARRDLGETDFERALAEGGELRRARREQKLVNET